MRVLFIAFNSGELSVRMASALAEEVDELCLMLPDSQAEPHMYCLSPKVNFQPFHRPRLRQPLQQVRLMAALVRRIRRFNPDVIHFQKGNLWFNLTLPLLDSYPLVISVHDPRNHLGDKSSGKTPQVVMNFAYRRADQIIVHNEPMKQLAIQELGISPHLINVTPLIERGDRSLQPGVVEDGNLVLYFGRIWKYKGLEYFIRAEPLVTAQLPDAKFVIAGEGDNFNPYREMMVHPEKFIIHNEFVSYQKRAELFEQASVVVLPYVEATQSGVIPVAYTHAKPVIATRVGGLPSQVEDGQTGFLVPPQDEKALAEMIIHLLKDKDLRHQLGSNGRQKLEREWSAQVVARQTVPVYQKTIQSFCSKMQRGKKVTAS
ncbi:MAG: glycosyltransferase family 1 protein [Chloroflexota bacterium]|nr:MAG: glycosyltransferase family 1 protein [Chloroflexota bacterium]